MSVSVLVCLCLCLCVSVCVGVGVSLCRCVCACLYAVDIVLTSEGLKPVKLLKLCKKRNSSCF